MQEAARDGKTVAELLQFGRTILSGQDVMEGIPEMIQEIQIEATFPDGTKLVTIHDPIQPAPPPSTGNKLRLNKNLHKGNMPNRKLIIYPQIHHHFNF